MLVTRKRKKPKTNKISCKEYETDPDPMGIWRDSTSKVGRRRETKIITLYYITWKRKVVACLMCC